MTEIRNTRVLKLHGGSANSRIKNVYQELQTPSPSSDAHWHAVVCNHWQAQFVVTTILVEVLNDSFGWLEVNWKWTHHKNNAIVTVQLSILYCFQGSFVFVVFSAKKSMKLLMCAVFKVYLHHWECYWEVSWCRPSVPGIWKYWSKAASFFRCHSRCWLFQHLQLCYLFGWWALAMESGPCCLHKWPDQVF